MLLLSENEEIVHKVSEGQAPLKAFSKALHKSLNRHNQVDPYWTKVAPDADEMWFPGPTAWRVYVERGNSEGLLLMVEAFLPSEQEWQIVLLSKTLETDRETHRALYKYAEQLGAILNGVV